MLSGSAKASFVSGPAGRDGTTWRVGTGAPALGLGADGDFYLNSATGDVYQRAGGLYGIVANIKGAQGFLGLTGATGAAVRNGTGAPATTIGSDGDFYLDTAATALYGPKAGGAWPAKPVSLIGPQGQPGQTGQTGPSGSFTTANLGFGEATNLAIIASVASNALTVALKTGAGADPSSGSPILLPFRDAALSAGDPVFLTLQAATSLTVPSGATIGAAANTPFWLWLVGFNDGGTFRLGVINCQAPGAIYPLNEGALATSTALSSGAGSAGTLYTGTAVTAKAYRILGYMDWSSGLAAPGTWSVAPDVVQLFGPGIKRPGEVIQSVFVPVTAVATGATAIPLDNTIPQSNEGDQYMAATLTPTAKANRLRVQILAHLANSGANYLMAALFQDAGANAIAVGVGYQYTANGPLPIGVQYEAVAGLIAATTFKLRAGSTGSTTTLNGSNGSPLFGGTLTSFLRVEETQG